MHPYPVKTEGSALIITLGMVFLITVLIVAFLSRAMNERKNAGVNVSRASVEILSDSAMVYVVRQLCSDVTNSTPSLPIAAWSTNNTNVPWLLPAVLSTNPAFVNLVRQSSNSDTQYTYTSTPSANGRPVGTGRWNAPQLIIGGFTSNTQLPQWIYLCRTGVVSSFNPSWTSKTSSNRAYVTGRFAFNVYDLGGLLDMNVAGYPSSLSGSTNRELLRGTLASANLTMIPGVPTIPGNSSVDSLVTNRFASSQTNYVNSVLDLASNGFLGGQLNRFVTRQDMIRWVTNSTYGWGSAIPLPYITHFTREAATNRFSLSQLTNSNPGTAVLAILGNAINNSIPSLTNTADKNAYMAPSNVLTGGIWTSQPSVKIASIGANIRAQATTNVMKVSTPYGTVAGKQARPEVVQLSIRCVSTWLGQLNPPWTSVSSSICIVPNLWSPAGSIGGNGINRLVVSFDSAAISFPKLTTNLPSFTTNLTLSGCGTPTEYPVVTQVIQGDVQKNHNSLSFSFQNLAIGLSDTNGHYYSSFGTNGTVTSPVSAILTNSLSGQLTIPTASTPLTTDSIVVNMLDPRTPRGAGATTNLSLPLPTWISYPPYPNSITDTNPVVLGRPYGSVGELGLVFADQPWRSLDFVSSNSTCTNLLDNFTGPNYPTNAPRSGVLNLNTRQLPVLAAALEGALLSPTNPAHAITRLQATNYAAGIIASTATNPLVNRAGLVALLATNNPIGSLNKVSREAPIRALADIGQTTTWNLMIDLISQYGHFNTGATNASQFIVEGEQHYWMSIAIDRRTGAIVDQQLEAVQE